MRVRITNKSQAKQGVHDKAGLRWIKPGASLDIDVDDLREIERLPFLEVSWLDGDDAESAVPPIPETLAAKVMAPASFDGDGDGQAGGSKAPNDDKAALAAARAGYKEKLGKRPFPGWSVEELQQRMDAVA